jgi:hypothetical protein
LPRISDQNNPLTDCILLCKKGVITQQQQASQKNIFVHSHP